MKVTNKVVLALFLAAPLNLVSADESVFSREPVYTGNGGDNYFESIKEVKISTPMTFADVVVVAPDLNGLTMKQCQIDCADMSGSPEVVYRD